MTHTASAPFLGGLASGGAGVLGIATALHLDDSHNRMPWVPDEELQLTPPVDASSKRY